MTDRDTSPARREPRRPRWRLRALALVVVALAACLGLAAPAMAGGVQVNVNGAPVTLDLQTLRENVDVPAQPTTSKSASGSDVQERGGVSAANLVRLAGVAARDFTVLRVGSARLTPREVNSGFTGDPLGGIRFATFDPSEGSVSFFRPMRDSGDLNANDRIGATGGDLTVELSTTGDPLSVAIDAPGAAADGVQVDPGQPVSFTARVSGESDGEALSYFWDFGDGSEANTPSVSHVYRAAGSYEARLTVVGSNGTSGAAPPVRVRVGNAQPGGTAQTPAPRTPRSRGRGGRAAGGGGSRSTGGGRGAGGSSGPERGRGRGAGDGTGTGPGGGSGGTGTGGPAGAAGDAASGSATERGRRTGRKRGDAPTAALRGGPLVAGVLLEGSSELDSSLLAAALSPDDEGQARTPVRAAAGSPPGLLAWIAASALCVMLLFAGAAREIGPRGVPDPQVT